METQYRGGFITGSPTPTVEEKTWGMLAHLLTLSPYLVALPFLSILMPLLVRVTMGEKSVWVANNAKEALNFQLTLLIGYAVALVTLPCLGLGVLIGIAVALYALVLTVLASVKARDGQMYRYPATLRLVK